jgi:N-acetylglucosaminyldiphosphoundecaprenol N-acetyl-beta-D-mannosaminyltransferase
MARISLFGIAIDSVRMEDAVQQILVMARTPGPCRFVVTPNLDHSMQLQKNDALRRAYADASLVIADGWPVVLASHLFGTPLPGRVTGSDLVPAFLRATSTPAEVRLFLLGAAPGVAERAAINIERQYPGIRVVGTRSPDFGFEKSPEENAKILAHVDEAKPDVLVVGFGAPKQELWVHAHRDRINAKVALCVGATIDFLAGERSRAPEWMQLVGAEWLHRMMSEPRRLGPRYAKNALGLPALLLDEWRKRRRGNLDGRPTHH